MAASYKFIFAVFTIGVSLAYVSSACLNTPKILLPYYSSVIVNYTLHVNLTSTDQDSRCYRWASLSPEVASIQPEDGECSLSAVVSAVARGSHRVTSIVMAEDTVTEDVLRCIVIVDSIQRFEIETTTRQLYLEDTPEEIFVRGYDDEGNIFSSLEGVPFEWKIRPDSESKGQTDILRILKFAESTYLTPPHIKSLEENSLQGDMILVEGMRTGSSKVIVKMLDPVYQNLEPAEVRMMVIANLLIRPPDAYILKYAMVQYQVKWIKQNKVLSVEMPNEQYYLEVENNVVCDFEEMTSTATGTEMGSTKIILKDKNIEYSDTYKPQTAMLHVVSPSAIGFVVLPGRKWILQTGKHYEIILELFDFQRHKLYSSDNIRLTAFFPTEYFKVLASTENGTHYNVQALTRGRTEIDGELKSIIRKDGSEYAVTPKITGTQQVQIYDPILVEPPLLYFPWDPVLLTSHRYNLKAAGGSGEYVWKSSNTSVTAVNQRGEITTFKLGSAVVQASDSKNVNFWGESEIHVLPPEDMFFKPSKVEAQVGTILELPLQMFAVLEASQLCKDSSAQWSRVNLCVTDLFPVTGKRFPEEHNLRQEQLTQIVTLHVTVSRKITFSDCRKVPFDITFTDSNVFQFNSFSDQVKNVDGCIFVNVMAMEKGHTEVRATLKSNGIHLQASLTIAAYDPLEAFDPEKETVVAVGSSKDIVFTGGPQPWILDPSRYFQRLHVEQTFLVSYEQVALYSIARTNTGSHVFRVSCKDYGDQKLTLTVGNGKTAKNENPAEETASIKFICGSPVSLQLIPVVPHPKGDLPPCPVQHGKTGPVPVHCNRDLQINVWVTDNLGRKFDNISSLDFDWSLSPEQLLATLPTPIDLSSDSSIVQNGVHSVRFFQTLYMKGITGELTVTAKVYRYKRKYLYAVSSNIDERLHNSVESSIVLTLVEEAKISPESISIFNHPSNRVSMEIQHGSGYFYVPTDISSILKVNYNDNTKTVQLTPLSDGTVTVTVYDLCVSSIPPPSTYVQISGVGSIELTVLEKVEITKELKAKVRVLDVSGSPLLSSFFALMNLQLMPASSIISVRPLKGAAADDFTAMYTVTGEQVGHTTLTATTELQDGNRVESPTRPIEVFPPLRLEPRNITIIIGDLFQVLAYGGPRPQSTVEYFMGNKQVALISSSGLIEGLQLGTSRLIGKAVGTDPETGKTVVYSQDEVTVNVILLSGIRIYAPITRLQTNTKMPVYVVGLNEHETPFTFGSANPSLNFQWSINNKDVVRLQGVYYKSGIELHDENRFGRQVVAVTAGQVTLKVKVTCTVKGRKQLLNDAVFTDELQIQVFEELLLKSPNIQHGDLLITPDTVTTVKTNRDGAAKMYYRILSYSNDPPVVKINKYGQLVSESSTGQAALHITSQEEFGVNQTLVILVKVKPISYIMINAETVFRTAGGIISTVPVGSSLLFRITYHDDIGVEFHDTNTALKYRLNRYDCVHASWGLENDTIIIKATEVGRTILKVWDEKNPWIRDYSSIPTGYVTQPSQISVVLGTIICSSTPLVSENGHKGLWYSTSDVMTMDRSSGIATASAVGDGYIEYNISTDISTHSEVSVEPIRSVQIKSNIGSLSNVPRSKTYCITINITGEKNFVGNNCSSIIQSTNYLPAYLPFSCYVDLSIQDSEIRINDLFETEAGFDQESGKYVCKIRQIANSHLVQQISILNTDVILRAVVHALEKQQEIKSVPATFPFYPAFFVQTSEVHITTINPRSSISISIIPKLISHVEVSVSDANILEVSSAVAEKHAKGVVQYPVRLLDTYIVWEREQKDLFVELKCEETGQSVKVPVFIKLVGKKPEFSEYSRHTGWGSLFTSIVYSYQSWFFIILIIIITALAVILGYHYIITPRYQAALNASGIMVSPSPAGAASPYVSHMNIGGTQTYGHPVGSTPTPRIWSQSYNPQDSNTSSLFKRSPYQRSSP